MCGTDKWLATVGDESQLMQNTEVQELVHLPEVLMPTGFQWTNKTKKDSRGNVANHKARLVT